MSAEEEAIREKRTVQALKNDLMGPSGKIGTICRFLGTPIVDQMSEYYFDDEEENVIPTIDDSVSMDIGWLFCGLSRGMHLEIKYLDYEKRLSVTYKGNEVYAEESGKLETYAPNKTWEDLIEKLYKVAKEKRKKVNKEEKIQQEAVVERAQLSFLNRLKQKWGI